MSEGPIKQWRDAWKPPTVTTKPGQAVHAPSATGRGYCGRKGVTIGFGSDVTCSDCLAAIRADEEGAA